MGIIVFSNWQSFESKLEATILKKFPEVWVIENLSLINLDNFKAQIYKLFFICDYCYSKHYFFSYGFRSLT